LGAHVGAWSILMATQNPTFKVYAYEPIPENYNLLTKNIKTNNLTNIYPFKLAVAGNNKQQNIYYTDDSTPFGAGHKFVASMLGGSGTKLVCDGISLNNVLDGLDSCKVIKCDCEGCECLGFATLTPENFKKIDVAIGEFHGMNGLTIEQFYGLFQPYFKDESHIVRKEGEIEHFLYKRRC